VIETPILIWRRFSLKTLRAESHLRIEMLLESGKFAMAGSGPGEPVPEQERIIRNGKGTWDQLISTQ